MLCRIYKKSNTHRSPLEHDRDDSLDDMIVGVPPSMNARFHLSKMSTSYNSGSLLENDQNLLEALMISNGGMTTTTSAISSDHRLEISNTKAELPFVPTITTTASKRTLSSLYWNDLEDVAAGTSLSNKRFNFMDNAGDGSVVRTEENGTVSSIATLLNQLPQQTPSSLHQQTMLGSIGDDGLLRTPYQIQGMKWYG